MLNRDYRHRGGTNDWDLLLATPPAPLALPDLPVILSE